MTGLHLVDGRVAGVEVTRDGQPGLILRLAEFPNAGLRPHRVFQQALRIQHLRRILELLMLQQPVYQFKARVLLLFWRRGGIGGQQ